MNPLSEARIDIPRTNVQNSRNNKDDDTYSCISFMFHCITLALIIGLFVLIVSMSKDISEIRNKVGA